MPSEDGYGLMKEEDEKWLKAECYKKTIKKKIVKVMPLYKSGIGELSAIKAFSYFVDSWPYGKKGEPNEIIIIAKTLTGKLMAVCPKYFAMISSRAKFSRKENNFGLGWDDKEIQICTEQSLKIFKGEEIDQNNPWCKVLAELKQPGQEIRHLQASKWK
jgi:hypothetical protein